MDSLFVRVDNRLIHGQILEAWVPHMEATRINVVDNEVAKDYFRETIIRMVVPREVEVIVSTVEEFARTNHGSRGGDKKTIVLFSSVADAVKAYELGFRFAKLNLGNVHNMSCDGNGVPFSSCVFLDNNDVKEIEGLIASGVQIELRRVPQEASVDAREILKIPPSRQGALGTEQHI